MGPQKQSSGPKNIKIKQNLPARGPQLAAPSGNQEGGCINSSYGREHASRISHVIVNSFCGTFAVTNLIFVVRSVVFFVVDR